jgi:hypothetical protein
MRRLLPAALVLAALLVGAGCGGSSATVANSRAKPTVDKSCPKAWKAGWQRLADRIDAPVYCPSWMPEPLDARIGGPHFNGESVDPDRSYLVSFIWQEREAGGGTEVHVNLRGYPGRTAIPACRDTLTVKGKTVRKKLPCFSDPRGTRRLGGVAASVYTANQGADQWHVLYAWRRAGSLYTISEHVAPPFTYSKVVQNLDRMVRGLALIPPSA